MLFCNDLFCVMPRKEKRRKPSYYQMKMMYQVKGELGSDHHSHSLTIQPQESNILRSLFSVKR